MGAVYKGQGQRGGRRAMQFVVLCDATIGGGGGGRVGGRHTMKVTNHKRCGWDRSSVVQMLFEGDPARPGHPLHVETPNKQGECVLKIRCRICCTLISYHNNSWTCVATHIGSHNITVAQDIATADALAFEFKANGEAFLIHKLPTPLVMKKEAAGDATLM